MAETLNATAANIISSLGIKGATVRENLAGFVPVLDASGKINANLIPSDYADIAATPLSNVAYVDPYTSVSEYTDDGTRRRSGSIISPFKSISEAIANFSPTADAKNASCLALMLAPGTYSDAIISFKNRKFAPKYVFVVGTGECTFGASVFSFEGLSTSGKGRPAAFLQNVRMSTVSMQSGSDVVVLGKSSIGNLNFYGGTDGVLSLSAESRVDSTNASVVEYLADAFTVGNSGGHVKGNTVGDAIKRLGGRKIRVASVTAGSDGFDVGSSFDDITAESSGDDEVYDLSERDRIIFEGINRLVSRGKDIVADSVTANVVKADSIRTKELKMDSLTIGGYRLSVDTYGYLVVNDASSSQPVTPDGVVMLRDVKDGALYTLGVSSGRMYVASASEDSGTSSPIEMFEVYDPETKTEYSVYMDGGRLSIRKKS